MSKLIKSRLLVVNNDRTSYSNSPSDFYINLNTPLENVVKVELEKVIFNNYIFNINDTNNTFQYNKNGHNNNMTIPEITIPKGKYSSEELVQAIGIGINTIEACDVQYINGKLSIKTTSTYSLLLNPGLRDILGFTDLVNLSETVITLDEFNQPVAEHVVISDTFIDPMVHYQHLFIASTKLGNILHIAGDNNFPVFNFIELHHSNRTEISQLLTNTEFDADEMYERPIKLDKIDFQILDQTGKIVDLNGGRFCLLFRITQANIV